MKHTTKETKRNWSDYNKKLIRNGRINFWFDAEYLQNWYYTSPVQDKKLKRGRQFTYAADAIKLCNIVRFVYHQPLRQTEGLVGSILDMLSPGLESPCYTQICRRMDGLDPVIKKKLEKAGESGEIINVIFDSSGLKVYGEGEWKVRKFGYSKRRTWRKIHIGIDSDTQGIETVELTENDIDDAQMAEVMIDRLPESVKTIVGDGGYDDKRIYNKAYVRGMRVLIPPDKNAKINHKKYLKDNPGIKLRNRILADIEIDVLIEGITHEEARKKWKIDNNYHQRSKVETSFYRLKTRLGDKLSSRIFAKQRIEAVIKCQILNKFG
jgi:hypothetical protein